MCIGLGVGQCKGTITYLNTKGSPTSCLYLLATFFIFNFQHKIPGPGRIIKWSLFVNYNPQYPEIPIRMQVWSKTRPKVDISQDSEFELLYEYRYALKSNDNGVVQVSVVNNIT